MAWRVNVTTNSVLTVNSTAAAQAVKGYLTSQTGRLTSGATNWIGWEKIPTTLRASFSKATRADLKQFAPDWPEIEILPSAAITTPVTDTANYASVLVAVSATTSKGSVTINNTDTSVNPVIDPQWLASKSDQEVAIAALKRARQLGEATGVSINIS